MAVEDGEQPAAGPEAKPPRWEIILVIRLLALCFTAAAILMVTLNKQTKTIVVPLPGNTSLTATVTAKFQQTPAFVFFVIANAIVSVHNLSLLLQGCRCKKFEMKGLKLLIPIADMVMVGLQSAGAAAAAAMAELGKNGNSYAGWNKICDNFDAYCKRGTWALVLSFIAIGLLMVINALSTANLYKNRFCR